MRYVIEGHWRGYRVSQDHCCHREVYSTNRANGGPFIETLRKIYQIPFSNGTALQIHVREAKPREKVEVKLGYREMIRDAVYARMDADKAKAAARAGFLECLKCGLPEPSCTCRETLRRK